MWRRPFIASIACIGMLLSVSPAALASDRPFPATTKRGTMTPAPYPEIVIDGSKRQLAPGARIWNADNLIEVPASLRGSDLKVNYTENNQGDIDRVWILTADESSEPLAKQVTSRLP